MCQTGVSVWFVCKLCRDSFRHVDEFIEHKKEKHFGEFQHTSCIVFEETDHVVLIPDSLADDFNKPPITTEVNDDDDVPSIPFNLEITDESYLGLLEIKSELITYESEITPDSANDYLALKPVEVNPYVLMKRLTFEEIEQACNPQTPAIDSTTIGPIAFEKSTEIQPTASVINISMAHDLQLQCKLCTKQLQSVPHLKIHVGICALYHKDRHRYCVKCNRKFWDPTNLKYHRLRFHGTEQEKLSLYKFKCHICIKQYQSASDLRYHLKSHKKKTQEQTSRLSLNPKDLKPLKCSQPNCNKEFRLKSYLRVHVATVHFGLQRFSCSFSNCCKTFKRRSSLKLHLRSHTGERPYKCTVDTCSKTFMTSSNRSKHRRTIHGIL